MLHNLVSHNGLYKECGPHQRTRIKVLTSPSMQENIQVSPQFNLSHYCCFKTYFIVLDVTSSLKPTYWSFKTCLSLHEVFRRFETTHGGRLLVLDVDRRHVLRDKERESVEGVAGV